MPQKNLELYFKQNPQNSYSSHVTELKPVIFFLCLPSVYFIGFLYAFQQFL
jgi:hypothetical protein